MNRRAISIFITGIIIVFALCSGLFYNEYFDFDYTEEVKIECGEELDYRLIIAVIKTESGFDENALSSAGAVGLMQLMPATATWLWEKENFDGELTEKMLYSPKINIKLGVLYLKYLFDKYDFDFALAAYNAGEGTVNSWIANNVSVDEIPYLETADFIQRVKSNYKIYRLFFKEN